MKHYLLTRFNLGIFNDKRNLFNNHQRTICRDLWMVHRLNLFIDFTLPSVKAQTNQNFTWIILVDSHTPQVYRDILEKLCTANMQLVYTESGGICQTVLDNIPDSEHEIITTRLDNDDAIHREFISDVQKQYTQWNETISPRYIDSPYGYSYDVTNKKLYPTDYFGNANISLIENRKDAKTVWQCNHGEILNKFAGSRIPDRRWIITIHEHNVGNNLKSSPGRNISTSPVNQDILKE